MSGYERILGDDELRSQLWEVLEGELSPDELDELDDLADRGLLEKLERAGRIIREEGRPLVLVEAGRVPPPRLRRWGDLARSSADALASSAAAVGRLEMGRRSRARVAGTGWLLETPGLVATNRHVAERFASRRDDGSIAFHRGADQSQLEVYLELRGEWGGGESLRLRVVAVVDLGEGDEEAADLALLRLEPSAQLPAPLRLETAPVRCGDEVVVIGYPGDDPEDSADDRLLASRFGFKTAAFGEIIEVGEAAIGYDAGTTPGSSGSAVIDPATGRAVGLHFEGERRLVNRAVPAARIAARLEDLGLGA